MKKHLLLSTLLTLFCSQAFGFVSYVLLKHPTKKRFIVLYGDYHTPSLAAINRKHTTELLQFIEMLLEPTWNEKNVKVDFFFEGKDVEHEKENRPYFEAETACCFREQYQKRKELNKNGVFKLYPYEERKRVSDVATGIMRAINEFSMKILDSDTCPKKTIDQFEILTSAWKDVPKEITKKRYLARLATHIERIGKLLVKYKICTPFKPSYPAQIALELAHHLNAEIKEQLSQFDNDTYLTDIFIRLMEQDIRTNKTRLYQAYDNLDIQHGKKLDYLIGSLYFFIKMYLSQRKNHISVYAGGDQHVKDLKKMFLLEGYTVVDSYELKVKTTYKPNGIPLISISMHKYGFNFAQPLAKATKEIL